ncbi:hypothetical protein HispidOSU_019421, partial [Sigmodon hispidus]
MMLVHVSWSVNSNNDNKVGASEGRYAGLAPRSVCPDSAGRLSAAPQSATGADIRADNRG